jgi:hypothetical protein
MCNNKSDDFDMGDSKENRIGWLSGQSWGRNKQIIVMTAPNDG